MMPDCNGERARNSLRKSCVFYACVCVFVICNKGFEAQRLRMVIIIILFVHSITLFEIY